MDVTGSREGEVVGASLGRVAGRTQSLAHVGQDRAHQRRLYLLSGGFSKAGGRRGRCVGECGRGGREEARDGREGWDGRSKVVGEEVVGGLGVGTQGVLAVVLGEEGVVLGGTDRGEKGGGREGHSRGVTKPPITDGELGKGVGTRSEDGRIAGVRVVRAL